MQPGHTPTSELFISASTAHSLENIVNLQEKQNTLAQCDTHLYNY